MVPEECRRIPETFRLKTYKTHSSLVPLFPVNCYLVEEENEVTLIDAALPGSYKGIIQAVNQLGKPLQHILLTHAHGDHVGSLDTDSQLE